MPRPSARTEQLAPRTARWLVSGPGRAQIARAIDRLEDGVDLLALVTQLREQGLDRLEAAAVADAAEAWRRAPDGLRAYGELVFTRAALEQASDPSVAAWRARRFAGRRVVDLGCGAGSDLLALAGEASAVVGVERDIARAVLASHNVAAADRAAHVVVGDALHPPVRADAAHADPSRRIGGRRARWLAEYGPPVAAVVAAAPTPHLGITVSPGIDLSDPDLPAPVELEFIQREGDLTEAVLWLGDLRTDGAAATATIIAPDRGPVTRTRRRAVVADPHVRPVGAVVLEVAPAAVRARLHDELADELAAWRIARTRALLSLDDRPPSSPWWRAWVVEAVLPAHARAVRRWLHQADERPLEIATAGLDADPQRWWSQLGRPPRGPKGRRLLLVRLDEGATALVLTSPD